MATMTLCLSCSYRVKFGYPPWDKCISCRTLAEMEAGRHSLAEYIPPYKRRRQYVSPVPKWRKWMDDHPSDLRPHYDPPPELNPPPKYDPRPKWKKPQVWWPMLDHYPNDILNTNEWDYEGHGDPQLPYGLFEDMELSHEFRAKAKTQYEIAILLMPDEEWLPWRQGRSGPPRKTTTNS